VLCRKTCPIMIKAKSSNDSSRISFEGSSRDCLPPRQTQPALRDPQNAVEAAEQVRVGHRRWLTDGPAVCGDTTMLCDQSKLGS
jgi:hypothetical protein